MDKYAAPLAWLSNQRDDMVDLLCRWVEINTGSHNKDGLQKMSGELASAYTALGAHVDSIPLPETEEITLQGVTQSFSTVDALHIYKHSAISQQIMLCGHFDTVYGVDHPFQTYTYLEENSLNGPGVSDMKGGLVIMLFALLALERSQFAGKLGWEIVLNPDEELGSPCSSGLVEEIAANHHLGLDFEPSMTPEGSLAAARKGSGKFTVVATGLAAHAGRSFDRGRNAVVGLMQCLLEIDKLNGQRAGVTINIGKIHGGDAVNVVPDKAVAYLDIRVKTKEEAAWVQQALQECVKKYDQKNEIALELKGKFGRPPKEFTDTQRRWFEALKDTANLLNQDIEWTDSGGVCDGNNMAAAGVAVIDSLGARGAKIHSSDEYILLDSLVERAQLTALLLMRLASGEITL